jgi:hypothetical protein
MVNKRLNAPVYSVVSADRAGRNAGSADAASRNASRLRDEGRLTEAIDCGLQDYGGAVLELTVVGVGHEVEKREDGPATTMAPIWRRPRQFRLSPAAAPALVRAWLIRAQRR